MLVCTPATLKSLTAMESSSCSIWLKFLDAITDTVVHKLRLPTLVCRIDVHARLLILRKNFPLHGLIWVCTFIDFEKNFPLACLFGSH